MFSDRRLKAFLEAGQSLQYMVEQFRDHYVQLAIEKYKANVKLIAAKLHVSPQSIRMIARKLHINVWG